MIKLLINQDLAFHVPCDWTQQELDDERQSLRDDYSIFTKVDGSGSNRVMYIIAQKVTLEDAVKMNSVMGYIARQCYDSVEFQYIVQGDGCGLMFEAVVTENEL